MKISRAPFRISLFGGGTDFKSWYSKNTCTIIALSIDKYCYVTFRPLLPFYGIKYRVSWSEIESVDCLDSIKHPSIRECLKFKDIKDGVEIHTDGDLPARSGLGSSSAFTVAMLHACNRERGFNINKKELTLEAIHLEQNILKENVGLQDQIQCSYGGFNIINIGNDGEFNVLTLSKYNSIISEIEKHLVLVYSNIERLSSSQQNMNQQIKTSYEHQKASKRIHEISKDSERLFLKNEMTMPILFEYLKESWEAKSKMLAKTEINYKLSKLYNKAIRAGASCGKLLGAGGGGFFLFLVKPDMKAAFRNNMKPYICVEPKICHKGVSSIL